MYQSNRVLARRRDTKIQSFMKEKLSKKKKERKRKRSYSNWDIKNNQVKRTRVRRTFQEDGAEGEVYKTFTLIVNSY